uniref:Uncharacterized protein n=1 Tax=Heterorhabditis bacteriophora TaxID=37862 RepID=A0A1I7WDP4_HETBA
MTFIQSYKSNTLNNKNYTLKSLSIILTTTRIYNLTFLNKLNSSLRSTILIKLTLKKLRNIKSLNMFSKHNYYSSITRLRFP